MEKGQIKETIQKEIAKTEKLIDEYKDLTLPIPEGRILYRPQSLTCVNCAK